ncbi:MAG: cytochrome-c oxidase, cbb3-type subunit III [Gammaproteobacteria bacterium]
MSSLTSALIMIPTLLNIAAALWLLWWTSRRRGDEKQAETTGHVWDGDLTEYNKPLPRWWLGLFVLTVIFGLIYLSLYPGLGNYRGARQWSEVGQYEEQSRAAEAVLARTLVPFGKASVVELEQNPAALRMGRNFFLNNCAACHGSDARGAPGFPNLADKDWLWGGTPEAVLATIQNGRVGVMPAWLPIIGDQGVENVLTYVMSLSGRELPAGNAVAGKQRFAELCAACHGPDGRGNPLLGAPNLTDNVWLHGGALATIRATIANGRQGQMPAHLERLGETRTKLLAAYVLSLGGAQAPVVTTAVTSAASQGGAVATALARPSVANATGQHAQ